MRSSSLTDSNLEMLFFVEEEKQKSPGKNPRSKAKANNKLNRNQTWATLEGDEWSHHCTISASHGPAKLYINFMKGILMDLMFYERNFIEKKLKGFRGTG